MPLFYSNSSIRVKDSEFLDVEISGVMFYGFHPRTTSDVITRTFIFGQSMFVNVLAGTIFQSSPSETEVKHRTLCISNIIRLCIILFHHP